MTFGPVDGSAVYISPGIIVANSNFGRVYFTPNPATITFDVRDLANGAVTVNPYTQFQSVIDWQQRTATAPAPVSQVLQVDPPPAGAGRCSCVYSCNWWDIKPTVLDFLVPPDQCAGNDANIQMVVRSKCRNPSTGVICRYKP